MPGSTKGQVQIMEVVIVLIVFFMILGLATLFFTDFMQEKVGEEMSYTESLNLATTAKIVSSLPELHCSLRGDEDFSCFDMYRVEAFANQIEEDRRHYAEQFQGYRVMVRCIYPAPCAERLEGVTLFDYTPSGATNSVPFVLPIILYDPITGERAYGELELVQAS